MPKEICIYKPFVKSIFPSTARHRISKKLGKTRHYRQKTSQTLTQCPLSESHREWAMFLINTPSSAQEHLVSFFPLLKNFLGRMEKMDMAIIT